MLQARHLSLVAKYLLTVGAALAVLIPIYTFQQRSIGATSIDRLNFLNVFLAEAQTWNILTWIFGTTPITPLSSGGCSRLSFYESLFSSAGDGSCYSVILHSFLMRVVFDAGLLGLLASILIPWLLMRWNYVSRLSALTLTGIAIVNGASVSGINNPYVALPILLAILVSRIHAQESKYQPSYATLSKSTI